MAVELNRTALDDGLNVNLTCLCQRSTIYRNPGVYCGPRNNNRCLGYSLLLFCDILTNCYICRYIELFTIFINFNYEGPMQSGRTGLPLTSKDYLITNTIIKERLFTLWKRQRNF